MENLNIISVTVLWRDKHIELDLEANSSIKELGYKLQILTQVKSDTMRLLIPRSTSTGPKLIIPFSNEHSSLKLHEISVHKGKPIRMMGVFEHEIEEISKISSKSESRIRGFDKEEERMKQRLSTASHSSLKLPPGPYVFSQFRALNLPGIELNPPPSEALRRMHMLACDPGIIAIMNKHRWRVGIMTEMAPEGYVGISPVCLLGLNKNRGEEISLRLRTDDLKGFRKYESIKKTLIHELAHMVHSDHNADFYALNKQLEEEALQLDWTRSKSRTLAGDRNIDFAHDMAPPEWENIPSIGPHKVGGNLIRGSTSDPRSTSAAAALRRTLAVESSSEADNGLSQALHEPKPIFLLRDPADVSGPVALKSDPRNDLDTNLDQILPETDNEPDRALLEPKSVSMEAGPDDLSGAVSPNTSLDRILPEIHNGSDRAFLEPKPDFLDPDPVDVSGPALLNSGLHNDPNTSSDRILPETSYPANEDMDLDEELSSIEEPAVVMCRRINKSMEELSQKDSSLQTLLKIISNLIDHPEEAKYRRLRKTNTLIQRHIVDSPGAMDVLEVIGFREEVVGNETFLVMKRNDPGLLWLAKSLLDLRIPGSDKNTPGI